MYNNVELAIDMAKQIKSGRGRPKSQPKAGLELRKKALEGIRLSAEHHGRIDHTASEEALAIMLDEKQLQKKTKAELKELRRMAERLWDQLQIDKQYQQDLDWEGGYGVSREPTSQSEQWDEEHQFLEKKRKNAKKTKNIYTLTDKQKEAKGIALEPVKMELDLDATEAELEKVMMEEAILKRQRELQFPKGRRVVSRPKTDPNAPPKKSFWV
jgi:hypothetical protein